MQKLLSCVLSASIFVYPLLSAAVAPVPSYAVAEENPYYWKSSPAGSSAVILTLFCKQCAAGQDVPLLAVLRDTLGDNDAQNDRLTSLWMLDYSPENWHQRTLAAIPFFYWKVGKGSAKPEKGSVKPFLNLSAPLHPVMSQLNQSIVQWSLFDPMATAVRATSRSYRENESDHERLHIEEALSYLSEAPTGKIDGSPSVAVTQSDIDFLSARLSLRKRLLGGLVTDEHLGKVGEQERIEQERVRLRNWELLREAAEKTGLVFEPISLSGARDDYAILWFPLNSAKPAGYQADSGPLWKIMNIKDPWTDPAMQHWRGFTTTGPLSVGNPGSAPEPEPSAATTTYAPLAAYSLNYPRMPLLMVDFRSEAHVRRHEMAQRSVNQLVNGVIGVSHFANWYYFAGADAYSFVVSRRGTAQNRAARLDCYSEFRSELALDTELPPDLRSDMRKRLDGLATNPLEADPQAEVTLAQVRYAKLRAEADAGELDKRLDKQRRAEAADFGRSPAHLGFDAFLHAASFGLYTHSERPSPDLLQALDRDRRIQTDIAYLNGVAGAGTQPEIAFDKERIDVTVKELTALLPGVHSERLRTVASRDLNAISQRTEDDHLRADCQLALRSTQNAGIATDIRISRPAAATSLDLAK